MKKVLSIALIVILLVVFCVSTYFVGAYIVESRKQSSEFDKISAMVDQTRPTAPTAAETTAPTEETVITEPTEPGILERYQEVYEQNPDVVGWIQIEGTKVNYPVMQTPQEPNFYLKRNFNKDRSEWGSIYAREECDINKPSDNITLYGHNMRDCSMFGDLKNYIHQEFWEDHKLIFFDTLTDYHVYEIFSVFKTTASQGEGFAYHNMIDAQSEEDFNEFIRTCKELSFYDTGITPVYGDKTICLSTCEYTLENGRLIKINSPDLFIRGISLSFDR